MSFCLFLFYSLTPISEDVADMNAEMVLFHDVFAVLKQHCPHTVMCDPEELMLGEERKLFRGYVSLLLSPPRIPKPRTQ